MGKLNRYLIIALVVQAAILLAIILTPDEQASFKPSKVFPKLAVDKVAGLSIEDGNGKSVKLVKKDGRWLLASGGDFPAKKEKVTELTGKLSALTVRQVVSTEKTHQHKLEVAEDKFQRKVTLTLEGGKTQRFLLGSSPGIKTVNLRMVDSNKILQVGELTAWEVSTVASDWVESAYFKLDKDQVVSLRLTNGSGDIALDKGADGNWIVAGMEPDATVKKSEIDSLLGSLSSISLQEPVGREVKPSYGLGADKRLAQLTVVTEEKKDKKDAKDAKDAKKDKTEGATSQPAEAPPARVTRVLTVGAKVDSSYYVKSQASEFVVKVGSWSVESLTKKKASELWEAKKEEGDKAADNKPGAAKPAPKMPPMPPGMPPMGRPH